MCQVCQSVVLSGCIPADSVEGVYGLLAYTVGGRTAYSPRIIGSCERRVE